MVMGLTPHTLLGPSFYNEISAAEIDLLNPAVLYNISPSPFGIQLLVFDKPIEVQSP